MKNVIYRPLNNQDKAFLWEMLFEAAHMEESNETIEDAKSNQTLSLYFKDFRNISTNVGFFEIYKISKEK